jgi:Tfp pilus assembly protein PilV
LVELLVAILLIDIGLLALVAGSALIARQVGEGHVRATAVRIALNRLESAAALPCVAGRGSATSAHAIEEEWAVTILPAGEREIVDSVRFLQSSGPRTVVLRTRTPC